VATIHLSDIIRRAGALACDARTNADGSHHLRLRFAGGRTEDSTTAPDVRLILPHQEVTS
jgi:hypothetical protein